MGSLRRTRPLSDHWGFDRGTPVDRYYIERFLAGCAADIRGAALEIKDTAYLDRFGSDVSSKEVLDIDASNPHATIVADLATAQDLPADRFDCIVITQTIHLIYDTRGAIANLHRMLRPGGVLLVTLPCASRIAREAGVDGDYWRFTSASARRLFADYFGAGHVTVRSHGNVLAAVAFLEGMAQEELTREELEHDDPFFPLVVTVRAQKH